MRVLIAPLNWGLGHATRCLAVSRSFRERGVDVAWASDGRALALLRRERPTDRHYPLPGYRIRHRHGSVIANGLQLAPGMVRGIRAERAALDALRRREDFDFILSDNRYGCRIPGVPGAMLCHQVELPLQPRLVRLFPNAIHQFLLRRFDEVVVPDYPPPHGLAGSMSRPLGGSRTTYVGPLSRLRPGHGDAGSLGHPERPSRLAVILSGPEPARTRFEARVLDALLTEQSLGSGSIGAVRLDGIDVVRGLPTGDDGRNAGRLEAARRRGVRIIDFATGDRLVGLLAEAGAIVTRPGYTTVMDLHLLGRRAVFVPTPGQPEQRVLAAAAQANGTGIAAEEEGFRLRDVLARLSQLESRQTPPPAPRNDQLLEGWIDSVVARASGG